MSVRTINSVTFRIFAVAIFFLLTYPVFSGQTNASLPEPPAPKLLFVQTLPAVDITHNTAVLRGRVNPAGDSTYYHFIYGIDTTMTDTTPVRYASDGLIDIDVDEEILDLVSDTLYSFKIVAYNSTDTLAGDIEQFNTLSEYLPPVAVTTGYTDVTSSSVVLLGEVIPRETETTVFFGYGSGPVYEFISDSIVLSPGDDPIPVQIGIDSLEPNFTYHFAIFARNAGGLVSGADSSFTTEEAQEPPTVRTSAATSITDSSAILNAEVNPNGDSTLYAFEYGLSPLYGMMTEWRNAGDDTLAALVSDTIMNLEPVSLYHYRIVAQNQNGTSYGNDETFTSDTVRVMPVVQILPPAAVTPFSARLKGAVNPRGVKAYYQFEYGHDTGYGNASPVFIVEGDEFVPVNFVAQGLTYNTLYHCRLKVWNAFNTVFSNDVSFATQGLIVPPGAITGGVKDITGNSVTFEGRIFQAGKSGEYYFEYGETDSYGFVTDLRTFSAGFDTISVVDSTFNLEPSKTYHYRLVAQNINGVDAGEDSTFNTLIAPMVETGQATDITSEAALLHGRVNPQGVATQFYFEYGQTQNYGSTTIPEDVGDGDDFEDVSAMAFDLIPNSYVHYRIVALNDEGTKAYGDDEAFITPNAYYNVTFDSKPYPGLSIAVSVQGTSRDTTGSTPFYKTYSSGTVLELEAPDSYLSKDFIMWTKDGEEFSTDPLCTLTVLTNNLMEVVFEESEKMDEWFEQPSGTIENLYAIHFLTLDKGFAVGTNGTMLRSTNAGYEWFDVSFNYSGILFDISFADTLAGYVVGAQGKIYKSSNGGLFWIESNSGVSQDLYAVSAVSKDEGWVCGANGTIIATTNGGDDWEEQNSGTSEHLNKIYFTDFSNGWAAGDNGTILHTMDGGASWQPQSSPAAVDLYSVFFIDNSTGWITGENGVTLRTTDGGGNWLQTVIDPNILLRDIYFVNQYRGYAVGSQGKAYASYDGGVGWEFLSTGSQSYLRDFAGVDDDRIWVAGFKGEILKYVISDAPVIMAQPYTLDFDSVFVNSATERNLVIHNRGGSDLQITDISSNNAYFTLTDTAATVSAGDSTLIPISFMPDSSRIFSGMISVEHNAVGGNNQVQLLGEGAFNYPDNVTYNYSISFGDIYKQYNYRMVSLPGDAAVRIDDIVTGAYGTDWRAFYDNGKIMDYFVEYDSTDMFAFKPGIGFWLISKNGFNPAGTNPSVPLSTENTYAIPLQYGWNIISSPFEIPVTWAVLQGMNNISEDIYDFQGTYNPSPVLEPYKGYYFYNATTLPELIVPYHRYNPLPAAGKNVVAEDALTLSLFVNSEKMNTIEAGLRLDASEGYDRYDRYAPPADFDKARLQIHSNKLESDYKKLFKEYREEGNDGEALTIELISTVKGNALITAQGIESVKPYKVVLFDEELARDYDLDVLSEVALEVKRDVTRLKLLIGTPSFIASYIETHLPEKYELYQNYPNPFNPSTTIRFALPQESRVSLLIYSALGELISKPLDDQQLERGIHQIPFNADALASGVYFYRLQADDFTDVKKMILVK